MTDIEIRKRILVALYDEYREHSVAGRLNMYELAESFGIDKKNIEFNAQYLIDHGFAEYTAMGGFIAITPKGVNFVEGPSEFNPAEEYLQQSIEVSGGEIGQIFQAKEITIKPEALVEDLARIVNDYPDLPPAERRRWLNFLKHPLLIEMIRRVLDFMKG
jgi:hypothetical protein